MTKKSLDLSACETKDGRRKYADRLETKFHDDGSCGVIVESSDPISLEDALELAGFDPIHWEVKEVKTGGHQVPMRVRRGQEAETKRWLPDCPTSSWCNKWSVTLRPRHPGIIVLHELIQQLKTSSPKKSKIKRPCRPKKAPHRALEIDLLDVHNGLIMLDWSLADSEAMVHTVVEGLLLAAKPYAPFDEIVLPLGNDWSHTDNVYNSTTKGTPQPESCSWLDAYRHGFDMAIWIIERLQQEAPVRVVMVPGNHDRSVTYTLGVGIEGYFHNDKNVIVDASKDPYKFWRYGTNMVMFEHGHSIKPIRYASLFASQRPHDYAETTYHEVHCGDKHRRGTAGRIAFEEFGVGIEFLSGLTPTNEWHKIKSFVGSKRMGMAFVWNHDDGREAQLQIRV